MASAENDIQTDSNKARQLELQGSADHSNKQDDLKLETIEIKQEQENPSELFIRDSDNPRSQFPWKIVVLPVFLLLCGVLLISLGLVAHFNNEGASKVICFNVFGGILTIPGLYYTFQIILACRVDSIAERDEILADFPIA